MPIKRIIREATICQEIMATAVCNVCGKEAVIELDSWPHGFHAITLDGGSGDEFPGDLEVIEIIACEDCLRAWVKTFKHPDVAKESGMRPLPVRATHTETSLEMVIAEGMAAVEGVELPNFWEQPFLIPEDPPTDCSIWEHKSGKRYRVIGVVWEWPSKVALVHYQALYGDSDHFLRPVTMFQEPRFRRIR